MERKGVRRRGALAGTVLAGAALAAAALAVAACSDASRPSQEMDTVPVRVDPAVTAGTLAPRYLGYAFDTAQFSGGMWWQPEGVGRVVASLPDLEDPTLRRLVSQLGPSVMRVGGTDCDAAYFCPAPGPCELPPSYQGVFTDREHRREGVIEQDAVRRAAEFADAVDSEILFCVNVGPGPRDASGVWDPSNARSLIRFAKSLPEGHRFTLWEPGNEINSARFNFSLPASITPESFVPTLVAFRALVDQEDPAARVFAPGSYISPWGELQRFTPDLMGNLDASGLSPLDGVSYHLYATQSTTCPLVIDPAAPESLFGGTLDDQHRGHARAIARAAGDLPVWNTESASAQCGGQHGLSDTVADALWWADWIGLLAAEGTRLIIRHALVGADYALLDDDDVRPRPTFLTLVLYRRLVHRARLSTAVDRAQLKAHAYCHPTHPDAVTVVLVNPGPDPRVARLSFDGAAALEAEAWRLAAAPPAGTPAGAGALGAFSAAINGEIPAPDGTIPHPAALRVTVVAGEAYPELSPATASFVVVTLDPPPPGCQSCPACP